MGCGGDREKGPPEHTQKWDFMTLSDFKATSVWTTFGYIWLWLMAIVAVAVYAADTFTAVNLLAFDKWSSQIQPTVPFIYTKWIFAACILLSWILCFYEWFRAIRVIKRGGVAESYMDPLAVTLQSMRGRGWRRFLVFTELTKSKKGADYVAFFVYFAFNGAIRVILAEGPRQFVNGMTLYSVMNAELIVHGTSTDGHSSIEQFFLNIEGLAEKNQEQVVILFSMLFTLIIWVFSALSLLVAATLYIVFLWHYIPQRDGRLSIYCRRKVDRRLEKIVEHKVKAAVEEEERQKLKAEKKAELKRQKTGEVVQQPKLARQPTLPQLGETPKMNSDDKLPPFQLARQDTNATVSTLPLYSSRPPTRNGSQQQLRRQPTLPDMAAERPSMPSRNGTQGSGWSNTSYESNAPLLQNAGYAGEGGRGSPAPTMPPPAVSRQGSNTSHNMRFPVRTNTQGSQMTQRSQMPPMSRMDTMNSQQRSYSPMSQDGYSRPPPGPRGPPVRSNTGFSFQNEPRSAVSPLTPQDMYDARPVAQMARYNTQDTFQTAQTGPLSPDSVYSRPTESIYSHQGLDGRPAFGSLHSHQSSFSRPMANRKPSQSSANRLFTPPTTENQTMPQPNSYEMSFQPTHNYEPAPPNAGGYVAFNPGADRTTTPVSLQPGPKRNMTVAGQPGTAGNYFGRVQQDIPLRSATAPIEARHTTGYADILDDYGDSARNSVQPPEQQQQQQQYTPPYAGLSRSHTAEPVQYSAGIGRTSPPAGPQRSYTAGPAQSGWHGDRF